MKSNVFVDPVLAAALLEAEGTIGADREWVSPNGDPRQKKFTSRQSDYKALAKGLPPGIIESMTAFSAPPLNKLLARRGFDIKLDDFYAPDFGVVAIQQIVSAWHSPATVAKLTVGHTTYDAVKMMSPDGYRLTNIYGGSEMVLEVGLKTPHFRVLITPSKGLEHGMDILGRPQERNYDFRGALWPMIDARLKADLDWAVGMSTRDTSGSPVNLRQVLGESILQMDQNGLASRTAVAATLQRSFSALPCFEVKDPFTLAIVRAKEDPEDNSGILVAYHFDPEDGFWKKPKDLDLSAS